MRGHWLDRLPAIDADLADIEKRLQQPANAKAASVDRERIAKAVREALARPARPAFGCRHEPAPRFHRGQPLEIGLSLKEGAARRVRLHYRHVTQAETWRSQEMTWRDRAYRAAIPAEYTQSPYPRQYYFELHAPPGGVSLYPGFEPNLSNQPYFVIRSVS